MTPLAAVALTVVSVSVLGVAAGLLATAGGILALRVARRLPVPGPSAPDVPPSTRDAIGLGGAPPG
jgi:hypothetical protein